MHPTQSLSDLMKYVKQHSSSWINDERLVGGEFSWQEGYGAFSYAKSQLPQVIRYIQHQKEHHKKKTFQQEYIELLDELKVDYDDRYIFQPIL